MNAFYKNSGFVSLILSVCLFACIIASPAQQPTPNPAIEQFANQLLAAETDAARDALIAANGNLMTAELAAALLQSGRQAMTKNEFSRAEQAFNLSLKAGEAASNQAAIAAALRNLGSASGIQGKFANALDYFQRAAAIYETLADDAGLANALRGIGNVESTFGNYEKGIAAFRRSFALFEKVGDKAGQSTASSSLNSVYQSVGDFENALQFGTLALALARESGNQATVGSSLSNLANLSSSRGDFRAALEFNEEALRIFEAEDQVERIALTFNNIGDIYLRQNDYAVAEDYLRRGLALRERIGDKDGVARSNLRLGELSIARGDLPAALDALNRAVMLRETEAKDPASLAAITSRIGDVYFKQNDQAKAKIFYERALMLADSVGEKETIASILVAAARFNLANNERTAATAKINRAVEIASALGLREVLWEAQTLAGEIALAANDKVRARQNFEAAIKTIEESRLLVAGGERERQQFFESKVKPYHQMIELLVNDKKYEEAFAFAEQAKARVLLDVLQTGRAQPSKAMTEPEQAQETKLRNALYAANNQLQIEAAKDKPDAPRLTDLQKKLGQARNAFDSFTTLLYVAHPELKLQRGETTVASLSELNNLLPDAKTALLEFVVTENRTFAFVVITDNAKPKIEVASIEIKRDELNKAVINFRRKIAARDLRFGDDAKQLYKVLLAPVAKLTENKSHLIIASDGALWELPFQALIDEKDKYLIEKAAVSYAPSLSVLVEIKRKQIKQTGDSTLLAFGNPAHKSQIISDNKSSRPVLSGENFADLPEAEKQVQALSAMYGASHSFVLTGAKATETEFKKSAANYKILHFATHGVLDDASPLYSYILLASDDKDSQAEDGRLEARELMQMNLTSSLVVLSACETARGRISQGEGLVGLSWAFFVAGAPTIIASQWKVESSSTTELMVNFYSQFQNMPKLTTKAEALRNSSLKLLKNEQYNHPFYWAGFITIGIN